ncbi:unnamed protein product [Amoebophrya sp. A120]|nr:unnamed protein product [Amoebophrya sp. A120]|eukprot:GSA120T00025683001.1
MGRLPDYYERGNYGDGREAYAVQFVEETAERGNVVAILQALETFHKRWSMLHVGPEKGARLEKAVADIVSAEMDHVDVDEAQTAAGGASDCSEWMKRTSCDMPGEDVFPNERQALMEFRVLEVGTYIGYSTLRIAKAWEDALKTRFVEYEKASTTSESRSDRRPEAAAAGGSGGGRCRSSNYGGATAGHQVGLAQDARESRRAVPSARQVRLKLVTFERNEENAEAALRILTHAGYRVHFGRCEKKDRDTEAKDGGATTEGNMCADAISASPYGDSNLAPEPRARPEVYSPQHLRRHCTTEEALSQVCTSWDVSVDIHLSCGAMEDGQDSILWPIKRSRRQNTSDMIDPADRYLHLIFFDHQKSRYLQDLLWLKGLAVEFGSLFRPRLTRIVADNVASQEHLQHRDLAIARGKRKSKCHCVNRGCNFLQYVLRQYDTGVFVGAGESDGISVSVFRDDKHLPWKERVRTPVCEGAAPAVNENT